MRVRVYDILAENLNVDEYQLTMETNLVNDLGADELTISEIIKGIESEFDIEIFDEEAEKLATVKDYLEFVSARLPGVTVVGGGGGTYIPPYVHPGGTNPGGIPSGGVYNSTNVENPGANYEIETLADSVNLKKKLDCFNTVPDNSNTTYTAKICADLPNDLNPNALLGPDRVGHAFITLTKTNGGNTVTQTFGFYPEKGIKSISGVYVNSQIEDDGATQHQYNASYSINLNQLGFERVINSAQTYSKLKYNIKEFNCTDYALTIFNAGLDNNNQIFVPDWVAGSVTSSNYGTTPTGLYKKIKEMKDAGKSGATTATGNAPSSSNCN